MNEVLSVFMHLLVYFRALQVTLISPARWGKKKKKSGARMTARVARLKRRRRMMKMKIDP